MEDDRSYENWVKDQKANNYSVMSIDSLLGLFFKQDSYERSVIVEGKISRITQPTGERGSIYFMIEDEKTGKSVVAKSSMDTGYGYSYAAFSDVGDHIAVSGRYVPKSTLVVSYNLFNKDLMKNMLNENGDKGDCNGL